MNNTALIALCAVGLVAYTAGSSSHPVRQDSPVPAMQRASLPPQDLVSRDGLATFKARCDNVPIFEVPADRWLILTDVYVEYAKGSKSVYPCLVQRQEEESVVRICWAFLRRETQPNQSTATSPLGNPRTGLAFPPGSEVVLCTKEFGPKSCEFYYHMRGYLTTR